MRSLRIQTAQVLKSKLAQMVVRQQVLSLLVQQQTLSQQVLQQVIRRSGAERVGLIGASMGGSAAVELARRCPEQIERLLLLAPAGLTGRPMPVTDMAWGPDGAMYVITGGRGTQSGIYRIAATEPVPASRRVSTPDASHAADRAHRRALEDLSGTPDAATLERCVAALGAEVALLRPDGAAFPVRGKIDFAATQVDTRLGTVQLRARFANADDALLAGQFVRVRITGGKANDAYLVPQQALVQAPSGRSVFVIGSGDRAEARPVTLGETQGGDIVILAGLRAGDRVILNQLHKLRPGAPVVVAPAKK